MSKSTTVDNRPTIKTRKRRQRALDNLDTAIQANVLPQARDNPQYILGHYDVIDDTHAKWRTWYCKSGDELAQLFTEQDLVYLNCYVSEQDSDYGIAYWFLPYLLNGKPAVKYFGSDTLAMFRSLSLGQDYVLYVFRGGTYIRYKTTDEVMLLKTK